MDAIELLTSQHHTLEALAKTVLAWPDESVCRQRMQRLADAMVLHMVAEESVFYPALWPHGQGGDGQGEDDQRVASQDEHARIRQQLAELLAMRPLSPGFESRLSALKDQMQAHHLDEELRLFPQARERIDGLRRHELGLRLEQLQVQLLRQGPLHASAAAGLTPTPAAATPRPFSPPVATHPPAVAAMR